MTMMKQEIRQQPEALNACAEYNREEIRKLAARLKAFAPKSVVIAARGTSDHAGMYGKYLIETMLGIPVGLAAPSAITLYGGKMNYNDTFVLGLSQSGSAADVLEILRAANVTGGLTVSVTNRLDSPLAKEASVHLYCNVGEEKSVAATKTFTSEMYLVALLIAEWAGDQSFADKLANVPSLIAEMLDRDREIQELVNRYRFMSECFVLSRGLAYPIALEAGLKIQETNYVRARAYPISDFHHGPFAMVEEGTPVLFYMPDGPAGKDSVEMLRKLQAAEADILVVSDSEELRGFGTVSFAIPTCGDDGISVFCLAVFAQLFAANLAEVKGRNPDAPRGLKKVTITK